MVYTWYISWILQVYTSLYHNITSPSPWTCQEMSHLDWAAGLALFPNISHPPLSQQQQSWIWQRYSLKRLEDQIVNPSNTACVLGISKSASSCTTSVVSSMPWDCWAGGRWVPQNPENNKRNMIYQLHIQVYVWYIHCIYHVYTDVPLQHMLVADLYLVSV